MLFHPKAVPHETPEAIAEGLKRGEIVLVDVREPGEFAHERIEGAILHPLSRFDAHALPHPAGKQLVFVSEHSKRSASAYSKADHAGAHPRAQLEGGMAAWRAAGLPVITGSAMQI
jgi:rhodanese-related sulfurtransferase